MHPLKSGSGSYGKIEPILPGLTCVDGKPLTRFHCRKLPEGVEAGSCIRFRWLQPGHVPQNAWDDPIAEYVDKLENQESATEVAELLKQDILAYVAASFEKRDRERLTQLIEEYESLTSEAKIAKEQVADSTEKVRRKQDELKLLQDKIEIQKKSLIDRNLEIDSKTIDLQDQITKYAPYLAKFSPEKNEDRKTSDSPISSETWNAALAASGMILPSSVADAFLLSVFSAQLAGALVLLDGPVGTGKTSMIEAAKQTWAGCTREVIPVRPSWLDSSDLLGFFDPIANVYRPGPLISALPHPLQVSDDAPILICLDEMNLARIENYGADILSRLEYSRRTPDAQQSMISLYPEGLREDLEIEKNHLSESESLSGEQKRRLNQIETTLTRYPPKFPLPLNVIMMGTLNSDETTYEVSPKVIDRSFVVTFPTARAWESSNPLGPNLLNVSIRDIRQEVERIQREKSFQSGTTEVWRKLLNCLGADGQFEIGIPLSHRTWAHCKLMMGVGQVLGLDESRCLGIFLQTKILPRIQFEQGGDDRRREQCIRLLDLIADCFDSDDQGWLQVERGIRAQLEDVTDRRISFFGHSVG